MKKIIAGLAGVLMVATALMASACGTTLPNEISQDDWNSHRQYVSVSTGIKMSYVEMGNPNGEVVVLQHGMTDNSRSWSLAAPYFAAAGYHVYMPDLRGQGKSQETSGYYTPTTYATDLKAFFDAKHIDKAIVVGHSLGSFTIQNFWMMFPERCSKVVLVSSIPLNGYQNDSLAKIYNNVIKPLKADEHVSDEFLEGWYDTEIDEPKFAPIFDKFKSYMKQEAKVLSKQSWTNILFGLMACNINSLYPFFDKTIPAIILHGNEDTMTAGKYQDELLTDLGIDKTTNYKNYDKVGHNIQFEIPEQFSNDVLTWLKTGVLPQDK